MLKIVSKPESRVVLLTVCMVALVGLLVSTASYLRTRSLTFSYEAALETELQQKGLAYGQAVQGIFSLVSSSSPSTLEPLLTEAANNPQGLLSQFSAGSGQQNATLGFELWTQDPSAPGGYQLLIRHDAPGGQILIAEDPGTRPLVAQTAATGQPASALDEDDKHLHASFLIRLNGHASTIIVVTLDTSQELAFIHEQRGDVLRDAIFFSIVSVAFVSVVGGGLSFLVSRTLTNRKRAEEALRESELRYRTLASLSPVGIFRSNPEGANVYTNERTCEIMGITREEALGEGWVKNLHPDDKERVFDE
jgi:PAS domain-containing protein